MKNGGVRGSWYPMPHVPRRTQWSQFVRLADASALGRAHQCSRVILLGSYLALSSGCSCSDQSVGRHPADGADGGIGGAVSTANGGASVEAGGTSGVNRTFEHPSLLHKETDFERMRSKIAAGEEPWTSTWNTLLNYEDTSLTQTPQPLTELIRGGEGENFLVLIDDLRAMYGLALAWNITKDDRYGALAVQFLNAWAQKLAVISGTTDRYLAAGLYGYQLANIGEILRRFEGWQQSDRSAFRSMLLDLFYPLSSDWLKRHDGSCESHFWANWDMSNLAGMMAIGVFADRPDIYNEALNYLYSGKGNGALEHMVYYVHPGGLGQFQESGRDQGHSNLGVTLMGVIAKQAYHQGDDLFAWKNHRLLSAFEYIARYNVGQEVPYVPYGPNCVGVRQDVVSEDGRGHKRRSWLLPLNHYRNRLGIAAPWMEAKHADVGEEVWRWSNDELGWGSLTESLDPVAEGGPPQDLQGHRRGNAIVLSWWGSVGAQSYTLERAYTVDGAFSALATIPADQDLTFTEPNPEASRTYSYRVRANFADAVSSDWSATTEVEVGPTLKLQLSFDAVSEVGIVKNDIDASDGAQLMAGAILSPGHSGQALTLDGNTAYAEVAPELIQELSDFTIASWVLVDQEQTSARLFDFGASDQRYLAFAPHSSQSTSRFMMTKISHFAEEAVETAPIAVGTWTHVAITLSGSTAILYINGREASRNDGMIWAPYRLGIEKAWLGRSQYSVDPLFAGKIDDFRIYAGALDASQVLALSGS